MIDDSVFKNQKSEKEAAEEARRIVGTDPAPIHEKVFGKEERIVAPIHEKVFGKDDLAAETSEAKAETAKESVTFTMKDLMHVREMLEHGDLIRERLIELNEGGKLNLASFTKVFEETVEIYDNHYLPVSRALGIADNEARLSRIELLLRPALKNPAKLKENYDSWVAFLQKPYRKAA